MGDAWTAPNERGSVQEYRLWRAEWGYQLLPDDADRIEARHALRAEAETDLLAAQLSFPA